MEARRSHWCASALAIGLALVAVALAVPGSGLAQFRKVERNLPQQSVLRSPGSAPMASAPSPGVGATTVDGSSVETADCYQAGITQTICFAVTNGSTDGEWLDSVQLTFPTPAGAWRVACNSALEDPTDSVGYAVNFNCTTPYQPGRIPERG